MAAHALRPRRRTRPLACKISTHREQVAREISALTKRGLLRNEGPHILWVTSMHDLQALIARAT